MHLVSNIGLEESIMGIVTAWANMRSKHPQRKVGAGVYDYSTGALHLGYAGFPHGVEDRADWWESNEEKLRLVVHAETNAVLKALQAGFNPSESAIFCTHWPCQRCARDAIAITGIRTLYCAGNRVREHEGSAGQVHLEDMKAFLHRECGVDIHNITTPEIEEMR